MDIALHFASYLREHLTEFPPNEFRNIRISVTMFEQVIDDLHLKYRTGWSQQYREGSITSTKNELIDLLIDWEMLKIEEDTNACLVRPLLGRVSGSYPKKSLANQK